MKLRIAALSLIALIACSHTSQSTQSTQSSVTPGAAAASPASTTNPIDFPLYSGAAIVTSRAWTQQIDRGSSSTGGVFGQGAGTYSGHEVVAQSVAPMAKVRGWLSELGMNPPAGYHVAVNGGALREARAHAQALGLDFNTFEQSVNGKRHAVVVIAIDPQQLDKRAGTLIGLVGKYRMLPQVLRNPLDAQAKARTGFTVSQALDPNSPLGAALDALKQLRSSGDRGIILLDATKN